MIGVFGGTFDPPHLGHREAIQGVFEEVAGTLGLKRIWILPSGNPIGKKPLSPPALRLELARIAFEGLEATEVLDDEVRWTEGHPGEISTTWKILPVLEGRAHGEALAWIIGTDQLASLHRWDRFPEVLERLNWIVLERGGHAEAIPSQWIASGLLKPDPSVRSRQGRTGYQTRSGSLLIVVPTPARAVSSTGIREHWARTGTFPEGALAPGIEARLKLEWKRGSHSQEL